MHAHARWTTEQGYGVDSGHEAAGGRRVVSACLKPGKVHTVGYHDSVWESFVYIVSCYSRVCSDGAQQVGRLTYS